MSGSYPDTASETEAADMAEIAVSAAATLARVVIRQEQSAAFINAHGAEVNGGHTSVGEVPPFLEG